MKTIRERATEYAESEDLVQGTDGFEYCLRDYIKGANEQKAIDIETACEWLKNNWREYVNQDRDGMILFGHWESDFRKVMEE